MVKGLKNLTRKKWYKFPHSRHRQLLRIGQVYISTMIQLLDTPSVHQARGQYLEQQLIRAEEISILRDKLKWCYRREGVNHYQNCRELANQYMEMLGEMKSGYLKPLKRPYSFNT
jgi:hypothetical protein